MSNRFKIGLFLLLIVTSASCSQQDRPKQEAKETRYPQRIVSHLPSLTEIAYALGAGDRVVGVSDFCTFPEDATRKTRVGGMINPNVDAVLGLRPDLILLMDNQQELKAKYVKLGLPVLRVKTEKYRDVMQSIGIIGERLGLKTEADNLNARIEKELDTIRSKTKGHKKVKTLIIIGHESGSLRDIWTSGTGSFHDEMLEIAGGENMVEDSPAKYPMISKEAILRASPEAIVVLFPTPISEEDRQKEVALWKPLGYIDAYQSNRICIIGADWAHKQGPRMPEIAKAFYECLHGAKESQR